MGPHCGAAAAPAAPIGVDVAAGEGKEKDKDDVRDYVHDDSGVGPCPASPPLPPPRAPPSSSSAVSLGDADDNDNIDADPLARTGGEGSVAVGEVGRNYRPALLPPKTATTGVDTGGGVGDGERDDWSDLVSVAEVETRVRHSRDRRSPRRPGPSVEKKEEEEEERESSSSLLKFLSHQASARIRLLARDGKGGFLRQYSESDLGGGRGTPPAKGDGRRKKREKKEKGKRRRLLDVDDESGGDPAEGGLVSDLVRIVTPAQFLLPPTTPFVAFLEETFRRTATSHPPPPLPAVVRSVVERVYERYELDPPKGEESSGSHPPSPPHTPERRRRGRAVVPPSAAVVAPVASEFAFLLRRGSGEGVGEEDDDGEVGAKDDPCQSSAAAREAAGEAENAFEDKDGDGNGGGSLFRRSVDLVAGTRSRNPLLAGGGGSGGATGRYVGNHFTAGLANISTLFREVEVEVEGRKRRPPPLLARLHPPLPALAPAVDERRTGETADASVLPPSASRSERGRDWRRGRSLADGGGVRAGTAGGRFSSPVRKRSRAAEQDEEAVHSTPVSSQRENGGRWRVSDHCRSTPTAAVRGLLFGEAMSPSGGGFVAETPVKAQPVSRRLPHSASGSEWDSPSCYSVVEESPVRRPLGCVATLVAKAALAARKNRR